ncbi:MAG: DUF1127 domain-containing protein [Pseudolabrys sp.]
MLMRNAPRPARSDAYAELARQYPSLALIIDACFAACAAAAHAYRFRRTRRILTAFDGDRLRDIGFTRADLSNGRLGRVLKSQHPAARPDESWAGLWRSALAADRCRKALVALGHDQLHALSEQGLKARREALHDHRSGCTCRASGAKP